MQAVERQGWMSFLTTPVSTDVPAPEPYVLVAVLDNGKTANLGMAQHFPARKVYRMMNGSLEVAEWTRGLDGVFVTDSGRYRVLTQHEHTLLKRKEAARTGRHLNESFNLAVGADDQAGGSRMWPPSAEGHSLCSRTKAHRTSHGTHSTSHRDGPKQQKRGDHCGAGSGE